jgi:hypothetical protein
MDLHPQWHRVLIKRESSNLYHDVERMLERGYQTWPTLASGREAIGKLLRKTFSERDSHVITQANPMRLQSLRADTRATTIAARPCFLCPEHFPPEELGILWEHLALLPNPFPALPEHLTIASTRHEPQLIADRWNLYLRLARELGPSMAVTFNGAGAGASAPDHFHFQACRADALPLLSEAQHLKPCFATITSWGRRVLTFRDDNLSALEHRLSFAHRLLPTPPHPFTEPLLNVVIHFDGQEFRALLIPRAKHRPECFHATDERRVIISPAVLEMAGVVITPDQDNFNKVNERLIRDVYGEVSLEEEPFTRVVHSLEKASA